MKTYVTFIMIFTCFYLINADQENVTGQNRATNFSLNLKRIQILTLSS